MKYSTRVFNLVKVLTIKANTSLREDVILSLRKAYLKETDRKSKYFLKLILENARVAHRKQVPICQDTGLPVVFLEAGGDVSLNSEILAAAERGVIQGYKEGGLRTSAVDALHRGKPFHLMPLIHTEFNAKRTGLKITVFPKGFGSENKSRLAMLNPTSSIDDIEAFIIDSVKLAGPDACPPFIVGVGIGGTSDHALLLAKKALLERIDKPNPSVYLNRLERRFLDKINSLKIGVMGLRGRVTCCAVKIKAHPTHIAGLPLGLNISCHALRSATGVIKKV